MTKLALISLLLIGGSLLTAVSQNGATSLSAQTRPTFRANLDVVTMDVSVLDDDRRPVRGLTAEDFAVTEQGMARPIVAFKAVDLPDRSRAGARWLQHVAPDVSSNTFQPDRLVVILLDDVNVNANSANLTAVIKIGRAIVEHLGPADLAAVVYPLQTGRGVDFTTDRELLNAAIGKYTSFKPPPADGPPAFCMHNTCITDAMRAIARVTAAWPDRRKTIAYVSSEGRYQYGPLNIEQNNFQANAYAFDSVPDLMDTFRELQRANVTVYQFDPRGLEESFTDLNIGMFADNTGGRIVTRSNAPWERTSEMFVENNSYYMIGFEPSGRSSRDEFRPVGVTVRNKNHSVRTRSGYFNGVARQDAKANVPASDLDRAMSGAVVAADLPLTLTAAPFRVAGTTKAAVAVVSGLDRRTDERGADNVEVAVRAFDATTSTRESRGLWTSRLRLNPRATASGQVHYDTLSRLDLAPGRYEIRLAMKSEAANLTGGVVLTLTVPDFGKEPLSLSGMVLTRGDTPPPNDPISNVLSLRPTTVRTFVRSDSVGALIRVYQGGKDMTRQVRIVVRIVDATDAPVFQWTGTLAPSDFDRATRAAEWRMPLQLTGLAPGEYLLTFEATMADHPTRARQVRFHME